MIYESKRSIVAVVLQVAGGFGPVSTNRLKDFLVVHVYSFQALREPASSSIVILADCLVIAEEVLESESLYVIIDSRC